MFTIKCVRRSYFYKCLQSVYMVIPGLVQSGSGNLLTTGSFDEKFKTNAVDLKN